jgi:transposase-like protein
VALDSGVRSKEQKIVKETFVPGTLVVVIAQKYEMNANQVRVALTEPAGTAGRKI